MRVVASAEVDLAGAVVPLVRQVGQLVTRHLQDAATADARAR